MTEKTIGHYRLLYPLGVGGMGEVHLAEDTRLERKVALKLLPEETVESESLDRFRREARAIAALSHRNIVTLFSVEESQGRHFLTMEYVEGQTLSERISGTAMPIATLLEIGIALADALETAHAQGVIHRDLKPSNVMLTNDGLPKILDFGLVKRDQDFGDAPDPTAATELRTKAGTVLGTALYMSPEQLQGLEIDTRTDLFSLGVILFEMATGRRPFRGESSAALVSSILRDTPPELGRGRQGLSKGLAAIIARCLEKEPEKRYQSATEVRADLEALLAAEAEKESRRQAAMARQGISKWLTYGLLALGGALTLAWLMNPIRPATDRQSLAVLPFANLSGDASLDYLGQGMSAGLMTQLGEAANLRIASRSAAWDSAESPSEMAQRFGIGSLVEGEIQQEGQRVNVNVRLTDVASGITLWDQSFDGSRGAAMQLQREISQALISILSISLSQREIDRMARDPSRSFEAYEAFLRGIEAFVVIDNATEIETAITHFGEAIRLDPEFALAYCKLSESLWGLHFLRPDPALLVEADEAARRALEIDPELPAAQIAMARLQRGHGDAGASIPQIEAALENHPKPDEAYIELAASYEQLGDLQGAEKNLRAAAALKDDWYPHNTLGLFLGRHGRLPEARVAFDRAVELAGDRSDQPRENLGRTALSEGRFDEAIRIFESLPKPIRSSTLAANLGTAYYYSDHPNKWRGTELYYKLAIKLAPGTVVLHLNLGDFFSERGRTDEGRETYLKALDLAIEQLAENPEWVALAIRRATIEAKLDRCEAAVPHAAELALTAPRNARNLYRLAKVFALCGEDRAAIDALEQAKELGAPTSRIALDQEFRSLADNPAFRSLIGEG